MKKRYQLSLNEETVEQLKADFTVLCLPPATLSNMVNEWLTAFSPVVHKMADKKRRGEQLTFDELAGAIVAEFSNALKP